MAAGANSVSQPCEIRGFTPADASAVHRWFNNREATRMLTEQRDSFTVANAEGWTRAAVEAAGNDRKFAIVLPEVEQPVGFTGLYGLFGQLAPELGCLIGDPVHGRGIGRWAERLTAIRAFEEFGAHRLYCRILGFNEPSKRAFAAQGWRHEGTMPGQVKRGDELIDLEIWGVTPKQFYAAIAEW